MKRHRHTEEILDELKPEIKGKIENETSIQGRIPYTSIGNNYTISIRQNHRQLTTPLTKTHHTEKDSS